MTVRRWIVMSILGSALLAGTSEAQQEYNYNVGPNYVDMSGTSCRSTLEQDTNLQRLPGEVQAAFSSATVVCPVNRRGTGVYGRPGNLNSETILTVTSMTVTATDAGTGNVRCYAYADRLTTNSIIYGTARYLCGTAGGCSSATTYTGTNDITLQFPTFNDSRTVNFGYICELPRYSKVLYSSTAITPNL
jgi:hypothetical protein